MAEMRERWLNEAYYNRKKDYCRQSGKTCSAESRNIFYEEWADYQEEWADNFSMN